MTALRILLVEDNPDDELLLGRELRKGGREAETVRVETREEFVAALERGGWDLIISDYFLPGFGGMEALAILRTRGDEIPFILASGTIGEEIAVESIQAGANDYLLKQNLLRLVPAVNRALRDAENRRERRLAQQSLRESRERLELIFNAVSEFLVFLTRSGEDRWVFTSANQAFTRAMARVGVPLDPGALLGRDAAEFEESVFALDPETRTWLRDQRREAVRAGHPVRGERPLVFPGGTFIGEFTHIPVCDPDGTCRHILIDGRDVTELRRAEREERSAREQMIRAQKMDALGQLAGGIAHDFNNLLTGILGYAELALCASDAGQTQECTRQIIRAAERAKELVRRILLFSRRQPSVREPLPVADVVREVLTLTTASFPKTIEVRAQLPSPGPRALVDSGQLHQVILNLCTNAHQAMPSGGRITLTVEEVERDQSFCRNHPPLVPGRFARITVSDTGVGMTPETLQRIFEPFFTTKGPGQGTGLGLSVVHTIVREHQGAITVSSALGRGTTFDIYLPTTSATRTVPDERANRHGHGERILCVDDDPTIVGLTSQMLIQLGYRPTGFTNPLEALAAFERDPSGFEAVVTDNRMAVMSGLAFARSVRARRGNVPLLLATGVLDSDELEPFRALSGTDVLRKPYTLAQLAEVLTRLLSESVISHQ
jgi:signal transduction histidine kinase/CheY-like chemotaxis protein